MSNELCITEMLSDSKKFINMDEFIADLDTSYSIGGVVLKWLNKYESQKYPTDSIFIMNVIWRMRVRGMKQKELVEYSGISKSTIGRILEGETDPKLSQMIAIAEALGSTPEQLLTVKGVQAVDDLVVGAVYRSHADWLFMRLVRLVRECPTCKIMLKDVFDIPEKHPGRIVSRQPSHEKQVQTWVDNQKGCEFRR